MSKLLKQLKQQLKEKDAEIEYLKNEKDGIEQANELLNKMFIEVKEELEGKNKEIENLNFALKVEKNYYTNSYKQNERLKDKLGTITTYNQELLRALDLMRKYMFNVMCADDVPSVDYFIKRAQEGAKEC